MVIGLTAAVPTTLGTAGPALGEPEGDGGFRVCRPSTCVWTSAHDVATGPVAVPSGGRASLRVLRWYEDCGPNFEMALVTALEEIATGMRFELSRSTCPAPVVDPPAPDPQIPPTAQDVWDEVPLWMPTASLAPACRGVVGLPTEVWARPSPPVVASVTLNGATWAVTAEAVGWRVEVDGADGDARVAAAAVPGTAADPLGELLFSQRGRSVVLVTETWTGSYAGPSGTFTLDYVDVTAVVTNYRVVEVQAVGVGPGAHVADPTADLACDQ